VSDTVTVTTFDANEEVSGTVSDSISYNKELTGTDPDTIVDSAGSFASAGYKAGDTITITGSADNDGTYTIARVEDGVITLEGGETLTPEDAGADITIVANPVTASTIEFVDNDPDPDTIVDSVGSFEDAGYEEGDTITITGSGDNDGTYTIASVEDGVITLDEADSLTTEEAGADITSTVIDMISTQSGQGRTPVHRL